VYGDVLALGGGTLRHLVPGPTLFSWVRDESANKVGEICKSHFAGDFRNRAE